MADDILNDISFTQNRELTWLKFNERVLDEAWDSDVELLERLKFLGIFDSNLDEFFMIRVGSLFDMSLMKKDIIDNKSNTNQRQQLDKILEVCVPLYQKKDECYKVLNQRLRDYNINGLEMEELNKEEFKFVESYFESFVQPVLSPLVIDRHHPFPHLPNLSLNIVLELNKKEEIKEPQVNGKKEKKQPHQDPLVGIVTVPSMLPKYVWLDKDKTRFILIENIIYRFISKMFYHYDVISKNIICVTRNADISPDDEDFGIDDYRVHMKKILKKRERLQPVRLEVKEPLTPFLQSFLLGVLKLKKNYIFVTTSPLKLGFVFQLIDDIPKEKQRTLTYDKFEPQDSPLIEKGVSVMKQVCERDIILSYPYESMEPMIRLLKEAAVDPGVISIKITIYRLASSSKIAEQLAIAAENGKEVTVLMELRARFDEQNNIDWAIRLEESGCNIIYGFDDYKVHSKICLITKIEDNKISYITQVGTGNYNEKTAKQYTDFCFMTKDEGIGKDAVKFFNNMSIGRLDDEYQHLLVAPLSMQRGLYFHIEEEIEKARHGEEAYILLKLNSISDRKLIDLLKDASCAGVKIDLIVRGICCLLPGVEEKTENIRLISVVGRFLEHHRVYCFGKGLDSKIYISSADFMTRNIRKRVEIACPIYDVRIKKIILDLLNLMLMDNVKGRMINSKGETIANPGEPGTKLDSQKALTIKANAAAKRESIRKAETIYGNANTSINKETINRKSAEHNDISKAKEKKGFLYKLKNKIFRR